MSNLARRSIMPDTGNYLTIEGGHRLSGEIGISGAKNSCLPILAATLLVKGACHIENVPRLSDIFNMAKVLRSLGATVNWTGRHSLSIDTSNVSCLEPDPVLVQKMRASVLVLGPLFARFGQAMIPLPGGCSLGKRPIDLHLLGMESLGGFVAENDEAVTVKLTNGRRPVGTTINLNFPSVGATENILMASALAEGTTILNNAAREPEIIDLANLLNKMGAKIVDAGESTIIIVGTSELRPVSHRVIPDRIEAGTYIAATAITAGKVTLTDVCTDHLTSLLQRISSTGCKITTEIDKITIDAPDVLRSTDVRTQPYPGFPTDVQPQYMALMTRASGESIFVEKIFERRFLAADELRRMGADIRVIDNCALVNGGRKLTGCEVNAPDIRAAAALLIAGLWADGSTRLKGLGHLYRGYEDPVGKLSALGARIAENNFVTDTATGISQG
ncbi:MAG: UDP-N-acetylglucosamine 1-carboxyvinyltransferase [bacterium]|nr:UDP-N-acetylglucosamine 1-carboxyvinyltransferase [bacterium]